MKCVHGNLGVITEATALLRVEGVTGEITDHSALQKTGGRLLVGKVANGG